jgi:hypothetical protein
LLGRWAAAPLLYSVLRIEAYPGGEPFKGLHKIVLAVLLERCDPADGKDARGRVRNRLLAEAATAAELADPHARGASLASVGELARQAVVAEKVAREAVQTFKAVGWLEVFARPGRSDLLVVVDAALLAADPRSGVANLPGVAEMPGVANLPALANAEGLAEVPSDPSQICHPTPAGIATPDHDHDARADLPSRPLQALGTPPVAPSPGESEEARKAAVYRRLSAAWGDGCKHAARPRGVLELKGAEMETLRRLVDAYAESEVAEAMRREILRAGRDPRGPRLDWVEDALRGARPPTNPPAGRAPARTRAGAVPGASRWSSPGARGETNG